MNRMGSLASKKIKNFFDMIWWKLYRYIEKIYIKDENGYKRECIYCNQMQDKNFYCIRRKGDLAGLFSYVLYILEKLALCEAVGGGIPVIDMQHTINSYLYKKEIGRINSWEYYFQQPKGYNLKSIRRCKNVYYSDIHIQCLVGSDIFRDKSELKKWSELYYKYIRLNTRTQEHINDTYKKLFSESDRTLGVLCRGTDYLNAPPQHPIQPSPQQVIYDAKKYMGDKNLNKLYLVTEDIEIYDLFKKEFAQTMVAVDCIRYSGKERITQRKNQRKNDKYIQGLDYITSIYLLAKCNALLAGYTNGSVAAVLLNSSAYEFVSIYSLGFYPE